MNEEKARQAIDAALKQRAFERDWSHAAHLRYRGRVDRSGLDIPVSIEVTDLDFVHIPVVRIDDGGIKTKQPVPHLAGPDDQLCYLEPGSTVLDRYDPGGTVLRCLARAEEVLGDAVRGRLNADFAAEYVNYWSSSPLMVDLPADFAGEAAIYLVALNCNDKDGMPILARKNKLARSFRDAHERSRGKGAKPHSEPCWIVKSDRILGSDPDAARPPRSLARLRRYIDMSGADGTVIDTALREGVGLNRWIGVRAPNAFCLAQIRIPKRFDTEEFMRTRKQNLPQALKPVAADIPLERFRGFPLDAQFLYSRNLGDLPSLAGRKIALIGCGTIGGFLALQLAQSGAGSQSGRLVLFDDGELMPSNLGRHLLGLPDLNRNKADACADHIRTQLPFLDIEARPVNIMNNFATLRDFDLVIDATGEETLSIALNHFGVDHRPDFPPTMYVWIVGNGGAAQALLCDGPEHACFKYLKPQLAEQPRLRVRRQDTGVTLQRMGACGDGLYAPFPVSASVSAAAMALDLVLDWNAGKPGHHLRTRTFDATQCFAPKDTTLSPSSTCPACASQTT
jgi:molybdopterin/thiamine biosynthesis adenylyltransferase